ncbi:ankyrin repeat and fibronectin type-III domain-containing protein 1-like isoform X2 [Antedon mediterranea]|uniref:ankyrin repeat and fibronectin type-III domain-containing protein 1-like isoform X2 n=1 Tax=Antedon mediterranea TaxID=105859 RepID=UPI003AF65383
MKERVQERWLVALKKVIRRNRVICKQHFLGAAWRLEDEESGNPAPAPSLDDTPFSKSSSQLYYPNTTATSSDGDKKSKLNGSASSFTKLARRLSQKGDRRNTIVEHIPPNIRRKSTVDGPELRKAHSLESLHLESTESKENSQVPVSPSLQNRLQRTLSGKKRGSTSSESEGSGTKVEKDKNRRSSKANFSDITALFDAVHNQEIDRAKFILDCNGLDINAVNVDDFTPLDIAIMVHNLAMAKLLLTFGARENPKYLHKDARASKLNTLINEADRQVQELTSRTVNNTGSSQSVNKETDKRLRDWEWKHRLFRKMKATFEHARPPEPPQNVTICVTSSSSILVEFDEPTNNNSGVITRYKIEWSLQEDFSQCSGEHILYNSTNLSYKIQGLIAGKCYYVRVSAFNMKGFGIAQISTPPSAIPSCWRDRDGRKSRSCGQMKVLEELFKEVKDARLPDSIELKTNSPKSSPNQVRKTMKKSIKNFFQFAPKFHKQLKRAVYVCTLLYSEDKVLVTTEDQLPIIEVDDNYPSNMHQDFLWFMKVACTWEDVDVLRGDLEKALSTSPSLMFRNKLLQAVSQMQTTLGIQDLGQVYYEPIRDHNGSTLFVLVKHIKDSKSVQSTSLKWLNLSRVQKRRSVCFENPTASENLLSSIPEKIFFSQVNQMPQEKGLYLGYMKLRSSVDTIRIQVQAKAPNVLPCIKIRDNSNVSQDEWDWLYKLNTCKVTKPVTKLQEEFQLQLADAARLLAKRIGVTEEETLKHRLCDLEVIDLNDEVSFIIMVPPVSDVCTGPGNLDTFMKGNEYVSLPVQVFEMVHTTTYHNDFIRCYSRLSSILEMENLLAQQSVREAFKAEELNEAKQRQQQIADFQQTLESAWKGTRWIMDVIQYARDKQLKGGVPLSVLFAPPPSPVESQTTDSKGKGSLDKNDSKFGSRKISRANIGILRVYPAYDTGLAPGTSVKLQVTTRTSSREIINLVIEQLNKAIQVRGLEAHIYPDEEWQNFGLVAAISGKEHWLPDDFNPLVLQNPWTKGKLYIKHKDKNKMKIKSNSMV